MPNSTRLSLSLTPVSLTASAALLLTLLVAPSAGAQTPSDNAKADAAGPSPVEAAFAKGDYERAEELSLRHDDTASLLVRARLAEYDDNLDLAARFAKSAFERGVELEDKARAKAAVGRLLKASGEWDKAETELRTYLKEHPKAHPVRLELGRLLLDRGKKAEGKAVLDQFSRFFNNGLLDTPFELRLLGEAMWELDSFDDAHYAFEKMYEKDAKYVDGLVAWSELLLSKYNMADAHRTLKEALEVNDKHPGALVAMARLEMQSKNYFDDARAYLDRAEEVAPGDPRMLTTRAELSIFDSDCPEATQIADGILQKRPKYLDAYVIKAACRYLDDDEEGFEKVKKQALAIKPDFAELYTSTADYAKLVHRYVEVVELNRQALSLETGYAPALLGLGIGLTRIGEENEGARYLQRAFNADPYNYRAYNMVELYEKTMPKYDFTAYGKFKLRTHRKQTDPLNVMVPPLVEEAMATFEKKYDFKAKEGLAVEIYPNPATFGIRSVGLPHISPHGICFGRVVIMRSPSDGNFNWRQVMWHEMAHVYHIQKAQYRVPRWFTEGLAEYETNIKDPSWIRHHDREIVLMMDEKDLPSVVELDKRFTQARSYKGILRAYHLSSLVIHFVVEEYGFEAINKMLDEFPQKRDTGKVIKAALGVDVATFDKNLEAWLRKRYSNFKNQFVVSIEAIPAVRKLEKKLSAEPKNAALRAKLAVALMREGKMDDAKSSIDHALRLDKDDATVRYLAAVLALNEGKARDAYKHGEAILDSFKDGYELRVALGHTAMMLEKPEDARVHLEAATQLYEDGTEAWMNLLKLAESQSDAKLAEKAERRLFELDQNNPLVARQRMKRMSDQEKYVAAMEAAERWVAIQPLEARAQRAVAELSLELDNPARAVEAYEVLVRALPEEKKAVLLEAAEALEAAGFADQAKKFSERAAQDGVDKAAVDDTLAN
ncbi:tetratricopeptide repeat protein [Persicimonas caeni]|uniref:Tetratricopeptide repeat protein n=1 Tax=Persicimonas caeni TaxID=2292766 RepID=A0A4Y6Q0A4_PERCE|nr:tetratricopeptide repeat protein [Persicimonas caeni]QDG54018.1 tetratricopeptide repeat protein [Persicimonas caeni]QED35239.1 tetratricopeptide repeat protein [Persicimonas caeni]